MEQEFLQLLHSAVFKVPLDLNGKKWAHDQVAVVRDLGRKQAAEGLVVKGIMDAGISLEREDVIDLFGSRQSIWQRNLELDQAVADLSSSLQDVGIRIWVVKGQTLAKLYDQDTANAVTIQYGGSMNPGNAAELVAQPDVDGGLIGGASLKAADFGVLLEAASNG